MTTVCAALAWLAAASGVCGGSTAESLLADWVSSEPGIVLLGLPASSPAELTWLSGRGSAPSVVLSRRSADAWPRTNTSLLAGEAVRDLVAPALEPRDSLWVRDGLQTVLPSTVMASGFTLGLRFSVAARSNTGTRASVVRLAPTPGATQQGAQGLPPLEPWCKGIVAQLASTASEATVAVCAGPWRVLSGAHDTASVCATIPREAIVTVSVSLDRVAGQWEASIGVNGHAAETLSNVQGPPSDARAAACSSGGLLMGASPEYHGLPMRVHGAVLLNHGAAHRGGHWWPHWLMTKGMGAVWSSSGKKHAANLQLDFRLPSLLVSTPESALSRAMWRAVAPLTGGGFAVSVRLAPRMQNVDEAGTRTERAVALQCGGLQVGGEREKLPGLNGDRMQFFVFIRLEVGGSGRLAELRLPVGEGAVGWTEVLASFGGDSLVSLQARADGATSGASMARRLTREQLLLWARSLANAATHTPGLVIGGPSPVAAQLSAAPTGHWTGGIDEVRIFSGRPATIDDAAAAPLCGKATAGACIADRFAMDGIVLTTATSSRCAPTPGATTAPSSACDQLWVWGSPPPERLAAPAPGRPSVPLEVGSSAELRLQCVSSTGSSCSVLIASIDPLLEARDLSTVPPSRVPVGAIIPGRGSGPSGPAGVWASGLLVVAVPPLQPGQTWPALQRLTTCVVRSTVPEGGDSSACIAGTHQAHVFVVTGEARPPYRMHADALMVSLNGLGVTDVDFGDATFQQVN